MSLFQSEYMFRSERFQGLLFVLLLAFLYGSTLVVSRFSVGQYDPRTYISLRLILASLCYILFFLVSATHSWPRDPGLWLRAGILGLIGTALPMTSMISSLQYQSSGMTSLLVTLSPVVTVVLAHFFLADESLTPLKLMGVLVAFAGAGMLFARGETGLSALADADWRGYAWTSLGNLGSGGSVVYARRYLRHDKNWDVSSVRMTVAAAAMVPLTAVTVGYDMSGVTRMGYMGLIYAALIGTFAGMWVNFYMVKRFGATVASQTSYVIPLVTTTLGALILDEQVTVIMIAGMGIIFSGITLLNWQPVRDTPTVEAVPGGNPISPGKT